MQPRRETVLFAGIVTGLRVQTSRRGKMAFVTLDDGGGQAEVVVFNETFDAARSLLREDQLVVVEVKIQQRITDDGQMQGLRIVAEAVYDLAAVRKRYAKGLRLACNGGADAGRLARADRAVPARRVPDRRRIPQPTASAARSSCPRHGASTPTTMLLAQLREWLAPENVQVVY